MQIAFHKTISDIDPASWNALWQTDYPFTKHAFLKALEHSGSIDTCTTQVKTGWLVNHLCVFDNDCLIAAMPLFIKTHSYGEYVFDWSWADAYHRAGVEYYPKLLNAIPFTPATGPRVGYMASLNPEQKANCDRLMLEAIQSFAQEHEISGYHSLFPCESHGQLFTKPMFAQRLGYQFHWFNQDYSDFDDFLSQFSSRKRKNLKKERQKVEQHNIDIEMRSAVEIEASEWDTFYTLYHRTYLKRSGRAGYLGPDFFHYLAEAIPEQVLLATAKSNGTMVAAALYFRDEKTLYGRYWGARQDMDGLHFECCYYQGIEYAIKNKLLRFDPGAQGEHKIQRGFTPILTQSYHWLAQPDFNRAIGEFVQHEAPHTHHYIRDARSLLPFKEGTAQIPEQYLVSTSKMFEE